MWWERERKGLQRKKKNLHEIKQNNAKKTRRRGEITKFLRDFVI